MLGQGKNAWQAEIDSAAEVRPSVCRCSADNDSSPTFSALGASRSSSFTRSNPQRTRPACGSTSRHLARILLTRCSRVEYRALEGFVFAVSPFNFTAIGGNLVGVPALLGNVVLWKPSPMATYASWVILQILHEAGLPRNVIQFLPCPNGQPTIDLVARVRLSYTL